MPDLTDAEFLNDLSNCVPELSSGDIQMSEENWNRLLSLARSALRPVVAKLDWLNDIAETPLGTYVAGEGSVGWWWAFNGRTRQAGLNSEREARAACQQHFAALHTAPPAPPAPASPTLTAEEIEELRRIGEAATSGPWEYRYSEECQEPHAVMGAPSPDGGATSICHTPWNRRYERANFEFIAAARNNWDALLDAASQNAELRAENESLKSAAKLGWIEETRWRDEAVKLRGAIDRAGFAVMKTSGDWSIHDVSEAAKKDAEKTAEVIAENIDLTQRLAAAEGELRKKGAG